MDIDSYMSECLNAPFKWGAFDCCLFAAGAIQCATGVDCMAETRSYNSEQSAAIVLNKHFGTLVVRDIFLQIARRFDAHNIALHDARNGDIVCVQWPKKFIKPCEIDQSCGLGVFYRNRVLACSSHGLITIPSTHRIIDIWRF
uniref:Tail fiber protein n=1 Tax=Pseudomonas phage Pavpe01 TaxID=3138545 RepID=A0AAU6W097_9VIRU